MNIRNIAAAAAAVACLAAPLCAQTPVTSTSLQGWQLIDGKDCPGGTCPGPDPATIVTSPSGDGNGSLQFQVSNGTTQPAAYYQLSTPISLSDFLSGGYSFADPSTTSGDAVYRLDLNGISNEGAHQTATGYGSLGFIPTTDLSTWTSQTFSQSTGDFFLRAGGGGNGQIADGCSNTSYSSSFSDREQTIGTWLSECTGTGGFAGLADAVVYAIQIDYGTFPGQTATTDVYADDAQFAFTGGPSGSYDFQNPGVSSVTPEPATMSLLAFGLVGLAGLKRRKRSK